MLLMLESSITSTNMFSKIIILKFKLWYEIDNMNPIEFRCEIFKQITVWIVTILIIWINNMNKFDTENFDRNSLIVLWKDKIWDDELLHSNEILFSL